jgi:hypothetical protein
MSKLRTIKAWAGAWDIGNGRIKIDPALIGRTRKEAKDHADLVVPVTITYDPKKKK